MQTKLLTIEEAAEKFSMHPHYVRQLIRSGKLATTMQNVYQTSDKVKKHYIDPADLHAYADNVSRSKRSDSRRKYTLYADEAEIIQIRKALKAAGFNEADLLKLTNSK
jgi:hypothetical protein